MMRSLDDIFRSCLLRAAVQALSAVSSAREVDSTGSSRACFTRRALYGQRKLLSRLPLPHCLDPKVLGKCFRRSSHVLAPWCPGSNCATQNKAGMTCSQAHTTLLHAMRTLLKGDQAVTSHVPYGLPSPLRERPAIPHCMSYLFDTLCWLPICVAEFWLRSPDTRLCFLGRGPSLM